MRSASMVDRAVSDCRSDDQRMGVAPTMTKSEDPG
jgi:hypothetical protein